MKTILKRLVKDEKGAALVLVLILLLVSGLIIGPLISYMGTGLFTNQVYEMRTNELYAADAGVEDAIWKIQNSDGYLPCSPGSPPRNYTIANADGGVAEINYKSVEVTITCEHSDEDGLIYRILSTATGDGVGTTIEAYLDILYMNFSSLLEHAIISNGVSEIDVDVSGKTEIIGSIWLPDDDPENYKMGPRVVYDSNEIMDSDDIQMIWPTYEQLSGYYLENVDSADPYPDDAIDIKDTNLIESCYVDRDLTIDNTGDQATLVLDGTVYVHGNLEFEQSGSHNYTINLNGETIFVDGTITGASQISISGSGCIIAKGDINFQPGVASEDGEFVLFMSIQGDVKASPLGDFTGCIAANGQVDIHPNGNIRWISPESKGLDFPMGVSDDELPPIIEMRVDSWEVTHLSPNDLGG